MNRDEKQLKALLDAYQPLPLPAGTLERLQQAARSESPLSAVRGASFAAILRNQLRYMSPWVWIFQALVLLALIALLGQIQSPELPPYAVFACVVPLLAFAGMPELSKASICKMWELEGACRYNLTRITSARLLLIGLADLLALTLLYLFGSALFDLNFLFLLLYTLVPFTLSNAVYLFMFRRFVSRQGNILRFGAGVGLSVVIFILSMQESFYLPVMAIWWIVALVFSVVFMAYELLLLMKTPQQNMVFT